MTEALVFLDKARRVLSAARLLLDAGDTEGACNRAYYAMFDAARAALLHVQADVPVRVAKTHAGLISAFGRHIVQAGRMGPAFGRSLNQSERLRISADYMGDRPPSGEAAAAVEDAATFVAAVAALMT